MKFPIRTGLHRKTMQQRPEEKSEEAN